MQTIRGVSLVLALVVLPGTAWAACRDRDLEGTYALRAESTGAFGTVTTTCEIQVSPRGAVQGGAACRQTTQTGAAFEAGLDGGEISVTRRCAVTGQVMIDGYRSVITKARMSRDKRRVTGAGTNAVDGSPLTFTATRHMVEFEPEVEPEPEVEAKPEPEPEAVESKRQGRWRWWRRYWE